MNEELRNKIEALSSDNKSISITGNDHVKISFRNNGLYDDRSVNRPILRHIDQTWDSEVVGVITEVNEDFVTGVMYANIIPELHNDYVCGVEIRRPK